MKFTKSLKFKLTIWYSVILSVFCIVFVIGINIWLANYMQQNVWNQEYGSMVHRFDNRPLLKNLTEDQIEIVMESRLADLDNIRTITIYAISPLVLLSFGAGYILADIMLHPLEQLNEEIKRKETKNLHDEIGYKDNGDEIAQLIKSFNRMSRRLGKSFDAQKEFVENASHELKTPLAIIQANLDTAIEDGTVTKDELKTLLLDSKNSIKFMNKLTEDLLLLSILDHTLEKEEIMVDNVVVNVVDTLDKLAKEKGIRLSVKVSKGKYGLMGNEVLLQRALSNIVENSIKYSDGSVIDINISKEGKKTIISIKDDGIGIGDEYKDKIFQRFYRIDKSRSRRTGGSGLGLSITKEIIGKHNGKISLNSSTKKGSEFVIEL